jgi:hypothetical protein
MTRGEWSSATSNTIPLFHGDRSSMQIAQPKQNSSRRTYFKKSSRATYIGTTMAIFSANFHTSSQCCGSASFSCRSASERCRSSCGSYPKFYTCCKIIFFTCSHCIASLQCLIFLISVRCVNIFCILDTILEFSGKMFHLFGNATDPDRPDPESITLDADPDPAK